MLLSLNREGSSIIHYNTVDLILSEKNQSQKTSTIWFLHEVSKLVTHRSSKYSGGCQGLGREGIGELLLNEYRILLTQDDKAIEICCTRICKYISYMHIDNSTICKFKNKFSKITKTCRVPTQSPLNFFLRLAGASSVWHWLFYQCLQI